jgi:transcriptional regulator with XRE-family HTH domain
MKSETDSQAHEAVAPGTASAQMRMAREGAGLELTEVAARTRVPLRHLEALERGDFAALPGITYCAGFARAYARAVGLDEKALVAKVREEIDEAGDFSPADQYQIDEPTDPARIPPRFLAWVAAIIALLLAGGYGLWRMQMNTPPGEDGVVVAAPLPASTNAVHPKAVQPPVLTGPVVLTAAEDVWLRIYGADGKSILQKTLLKGESYTVPADANNPMILTGRPDALAVTVGGRPMPPLGTAERTISDVPISAEALLARGAVSTSPATAVPQAPGAPTANQAAAPAMPTTARPVAPAPRKPAPHGSPALTVAAPVAAPASPVVGNAAE